MKKNQIKIAITVVVVLVLSLLLTYLLMSNTMHSINDISEKEALSLLAENAVQMDNIIENQLINNWRQIDTICVALENMEENSADRVVSFLKDATDDAYDLLLLSGDGDYLDKSGQQGIKQIEKDIFPLIQGEERILLLRQDKDTDILMFGKKIKPLQVEDELMEYLFVYYRLDSYLALLKMESFGGNGQIRIIDSRGATLLHSDNLPASQNRYLFFSTFKNAQFLHHDFVQDVDSFREYVLSGKSDAIHVILDSGENEIISFSKVPDTDWHIIISIDQNLVMGTRISSVEKIGKTSMLAVLLIVMFSLLVISFVVLQAQKKTNAKNKELAVLNEQLREANKAKSRFLSSMSHDIRTPMNAIIGYTTLAIKNVANTDKAKDYLEKILSSGNHLLSLINDVLDMSRIESGKLHLDEIKANLSEILNDIKTIVSGQILAKQLELHMEMKDVTDKDVFCDKTHLCQVLMNLISNAIKFTPAGGKIFFQLSQLPNSTEDKGLYEFRVKDTGIGMSQEFAQKIFDPFERERTSTVSKIQGTGLGMAISKNIVDKMGGTIEVYTEQGKGTEFVILLEMRVQRKTCQVEETKELLNNHPVCDCGGKKLLLVEDNEFNREIASEILGDYGFCIDTAENGAQALEKVSSSKPGEYDLVLMDVQMPVMDGYEATRRIRMLEDSAKSSITIIAMTANAFDEDRKAALDCGMDGFISKPINVKEVIHALNSFLNET